MTSIRSYFDRNFLTPSHQIKTEYIEEAEDIDHLDKDNKDAIKQSIKVRVAGRPGTKRKMAKVRRARFR